jgi:PAS domain S-box-containing protein
MSLTATALRALRDTDLHALIEHAPDGIFTADIDGRYTYVNEAGCRLLGYAEEERGAIIGKTIMDFIPAGDVDRLRAAKAHMQQGATHVAEWRLRRKDGSWAPVEVSASILADGHWHGFVRDISERKAHEAERDALLELTESDRRWLHTVVDTLPLGMLLYRPGAPLLFNRRTEELLGMTLSSTGGRAQYASRIRLPDGRPVAEQDLPIGRIMRDGATIIAEEFRIDHPDGTRIPVLASGAPIRDTDGHVVGAVGVFQDVSERMRMEEAIRTDERLLKGIFEILPVGIWIADASGRIVSHNPAGERVWRGARYVPVAEFGQYKGWWVDSGKPIAAEEWALARALTKGESSTGELVRIQCFDGSFKTIINSAAPLRDESGAITGAIVVNEDITALHQAQEKQRAGEQLLRTVFDLVPIGLYVAGRDGRITLANPAGERIWQGVRKVSPERYGEYKGWWVESGKAIAPEEWGLARALSKGETSSGELIRIQCFDGSFKTVINFAAPIRSDAGEIAGAVAVNEDITSLQHTQELLRGAVRAREEILATVTHDLRNPLSGLMMGASAVERTARQLPGGEPVRELATSLMDITRRMSGMVDDLLAVAVARTGGESMVRLAPVPASALMGRAAEAARPLLAREPLELKIEVSGELPTVHADADRILRVFANLLDNALKFTSPPGSITLAAERSMAGVRFSVANSGPALPQKQLEAMFRPFWQAGRDRRGAGLGLAICRSIVEAHGGSIWAEPAEGQRVRVCFVLPRQPTLSSA